MVVEARLMFRLSSDTNGTSETYIKQHFESTEVIMNSWQCLLNSTEAMNIMFQLYLLHF